MIKEHISFTVFSKNDSTITTANSQHAGHCWLLRILMLSEFLIIYLNLFVGLIFFFKIAIAYACLISCPQQKRPQKCMRSLQCAV